MSDKIKTRRCDYTGCEREATVQPAFNVWARGHAKESSVPVTGHIGIGVCDEHKAEVSLDFFLPEETREIMQQIARQAGKSPMDFSTLELLFLPIVNGELEADSVQNRGRPN